MGNDSTYYNLNLQSCAKNFFLHKISSQFDGKNSPGFVREDEDKIIQLPKKRRRLHSKNKKEKLTRIHIHRRQSANLEENFARPQKADEFEKCSLLITLSVYFTWFVLTLFAYFREFLRYYGFEQNKSAVERPEMKDFAPLVNSFEGIYARNCYMRVRDVFERPIGGVPGATVELVDRVTDDCCWTFKNPGTKTEVINVSSYNYLGFAQKDGPCADAAIKAVNLYGVGICGSVREIGYTPIQEQLEKLVAEFLSVEAAICFTMGFATNSMNVSCLVDKNSLIVSDQYNHSSLILGCRISGASIRVFKHNSMSDLERVLHNSIAYGSPKTGALFSKILIIAEGIYSMEGSICNLPELIRLKKKYKCYLYIDEAHSIGALGKTGRGVVEYWGCDPLDIDVLMGTFTKSFGAAGGYIAGKKELIAHIRQYSPTGFYSTPMPPLVVQQALTAMQIIMGKDGTGEGARRIQLLARNTRYVRLRLKQMGFIVYGSEGSPVIPIMLYHPTKCGLWGRLMLERKIGVVVVSFPATAMTESRCRICISGAHTKVMLDKLLEALDEVGEISRTKHSRRAHLYRGIEANW